MKQMKSKITMSKLIFLILLLLLLSGCIDRSEAIKVCSDKGLQYTGKLFTGNIQCVNATSGQLYEYKGNIDIIVKRG